jgi:hypothetical protein
MITYDWRQVQRALSPDQRSEDIPFTEHEFIEQCARDAFFYFGEDRFAIEVGSYQGASTVILAQFFKVVAIDLWYPLEDYRDETIGDNFPNFIGNYKKFNLKGRVFPMLGSTGTLKILLKNLDAVFCFVDGDHSYEGTREDLLFCHNNLITGGYLVAHDYPRADTVKRAVDEFAGDYRYVKQEVCGDGVIALRKVYET